MLQALLLFLSRTHSFPVWENTSHRVFRGSYPLLGLLCFTLHNTSVKVLLKVFFSVNLKENLFACRNPGDYCIFHMLVTENRSSFHLSLPPVPIVLKLFTNKVKSTSPKHLMLELICMQNIWY